MAATFRNMANGRAVRVVARDDVRNRAWQYAVAGASKEEAQLQAYQVMPEEELFVFHPVEVALPPEERPGHPVARVPCQQCGEGVNDRREVVVEGRVLCKGCAYNAYYETDDSEASHLRPEGSSANLRGVSIPGTMPGSRSEGRPGLQVAALVLAGGRGSRLGMPKPFVLWRGAPLVQHVVNRVRGIIGAVYVVARDPVEFSFLGVPVVEDMQPDRGPLMGLYSGMTRCSEEWFFVVGCDMPLLSMPPIRHMQGFIGVGDIVAARIGGRLHPLHAFYSRRCLSAAEELLRRGETSLRDLLSICTTTVVPEESLVRLDPGLVSFTDVDTPEELARLEDVEA